jgi:hypothetical protein
MEWKNMAERNDYSGTYDADIRFEDFTKEALIRLLQAYQINFVGYMGMWNSHNREQVGVEEAWNEDAMVYEKAVHAFELPLVCQAMNIKGDDVATMLKYFQMCPDGARKGFYEFETELINNDHALLTFTRCPSLHYFERKKSNVDIQCLCGPGGCEDRAFAAICKFFNPKMMSRALKIPPRQSENDICCKWEFKVER